jgi:putative sugar O-methyltransferase
VKSIISKIRFAWSEGKLKRKTFNYFYRKLIVPVKLCAKVFCLYLRLSRQDRRLSVVSGFQDHRLNSKHSRSNTAHIRRIIAAYKSSKEAQKSARNSFQIKGLWSDWIEDNYQQLIKALNAEDVSTLCALFENFNREQFAVGLGAGFENVRSYRGLRLRRYYIKSVWCTYRDKLATHGRNLNSVHSPLIGNPAGILLNGDVVQIDTFRHAYHAVEMQDWLQNRKHAVVVEIGGGSGGQAYQSLSHCGDLISKYIIFDIPEVTAISTYFLLSAFPDKRIRLFNEGPISVDSYDDFDIGIFPHFTCEQLSDQSVDLFHNSCSFTEMDSASSSEYLHIIERACRRYFSHINHELCFEFRNSDGSISHNIIGSKLVPNKTTYKRLFKKPRVFFLPEDELAGATAYEYLYERM